MGLSEYERKGNSCQAVLREKEIKFNNQADLAGLDEVKELIRNDMERVNNDLASYETIKEFYLTPAPFSIETGELTPSLKVKRKTHFMILTHL